MAIATDRYFPQILLDLVRESPIRQLVYERQARMYVSFMRREMAGLINASARFLHSLGIGDDARVAFCGLAPSKAYWVLELATMTIHSTAVIVPESFSAVQRVAVIAESRSKVAVVESVQDAQLLLKSISQLPQLTHILCLTGKADGAIAVSSWEECLEQGRMQPDHTAQLLTSLGPTHTALLFYKAVKDGYKATRYDHGQLLVHAQAMKGLLGKQQGAGESDIILTSATWNAPAEHIASCFLPLLYGAALQINENRDDFFCLENHPSVLVAPASYSNRLRSHMEQEVKASGWLEWKMLTKLLSYGKRKFEKENRIGLLRRMIDNMLKATVMKKVKKKLGGRLRCIIGADDASSYETQIFFHTFSVELVDIPEELYRPE